MLKAEVYEKMRKQIPHNTDVLTAPLHFYPLALSLQPLAFSS
jgi:hypothetical protein